MNKLIGGIVIYVFIIAAIMWFPPFVTNKLLLNNLIYSTFSFIATCAGIVAIRTMGFKGNQAKSLLLIVIGIGSWFMADVLWGVELLIRGEAAYPSIGDYLYLFGYIALFIGLVKQIQLARISFHSMNKIMLSITALFTLFAIGGFAYFSIYLAYSPEVSLLENFVTMGYGAGDIILIIVSFFLILLMWDYRGGRLSTIWLFLLVGFMMDITGDSLYAYFISDYEANINPITNITNYFYNGGYIFITIYFLKMTELLKYLAQKPLLKK